MTLAAAEWEQDATRLDALAARAREALDPVARLHRPEVWQGARALRFGQELARRRMALHHVAEQLEAEARLLRARAAVARSAGH